MATTHRRLSLTFRPEWEPRLTQLKKDYFYDRTYAELLRCLIDIGLLRFEQDMKAIFNKFRAKV